MTPTIVEEQEHDLDDDTSPDADEDDNVQGAGALPHTVSENLQKKAEFWWRLKSILNIVE